MDNIKDKDDNRPVICFLTVGELITESNLLYSQVIQVASFFYKNTPQWEVRYFGFIPLRSIVAAKVRHHPVDLHWLGKMPYSAKCFTSFSVIASMWGFFIRDVFAKVDGYRLSKEFPKAVKKRIVFICRSYLATHVAIALRNKRPDLNIAIIFDMRSLLSLEIAYKYGLFGKYSYVSAKEWERELIKESVVTLMTTKRACAMLALEYPWANITKLNIMGFPRRDKPNADRVLSNRWSQRIIAYVGSIQKYSGLDEIKAILGQLSKSSLHPETLIVSGNSPNGLQIPVRTIPYSNIPMFYDSILALLITAAHTGTYIDDLMMSVNRFSTKASEALSLGVPLIVSDKLSELAQFVRDNRCGLVYHVECDGTFAFDAGIAQSLSDYAFWLELTEGAIKVGDRFTQEAVAETYLHSIYSALEV